MPGMIWFDKSKDRTLSQKIKRAIDYYENKYGLTPSICRVNPSEYDPSLEIKGLNIIPYRPVSPGHLWIGYYTEAELEDMDDLSKPPSGFFVLTDEELGFFEDIKSIFSEFKPYRRIIFALIFLIACAVMCTIALFTSLAINLR